MSDGRMNGGPDGMSGVRTDRASRKLTYLGVALLISGMLLQAFVNSLSAVEDRRALGSSDPAWMMWTWELTSFVAWLVMLFFIWWLVRLLRPPRMIWPVAIAVHVGASLVVSLGHIALMVALRKLSYALVGTVYVFTDEIVQSAIYEYRKDATTYLILATVCALIQWIARRRDEPDTVRPPEFLVVQDGSRRHQLAIAEIDYAQAAGNYVEIVAGGATLLHRVTLAALEEQLGNVAFARIHRSRLVRRSAIRTVATNDSGDFDVTLLSGKVLRGSRRFRTTL